MFTARCACGAGAQWGEPAERWSAVPVDSEVIGPCLMPVSSSEPSGRQLVVDALETMWWLLHRTGRRSRPMTKVPSMFLPGARG